MHRKIRNSLPRVRAAWKNLFDSTRKHMTRGASNIAKMINWARRDNWRGSLKDRKRKVETKQKKH